jgi:hypothetical protein
MTKAEQYRASAAECFLHSLSTSDEDVKQTLKRLAARWYALADEMEERYRDDEDAA